jgi:thioredoxin reductase (NADPH)
VIVGAGDSACEEAHYLSKLCKKSNYVSKKRENLELLKSWKCTQTENININEP